MVADEADGPVTDIDGATAATFTPRDSDLDNVPISVEVKYTEWTRGRARPPGTTLGTKVAASPQCRGSTTRPMSDNED